MSIAAFESEIQAVLGADVSVRKTGTIQRFSTNGKCSDTAGWLVFFDTAGAFGDWRTGEQFTWSDRRQVDAIDFNGRSFCFTGRFLFGSRNACHNAVEERGGIAAKGVTHNLSYLVIGTLASRDWAHTSHGRKIEKVMQYNEGVDKRTFVLAEEDWVKCL